MARTKMERKTLETVDLSKFPNVEMVPQELTLREIKEGDKVVREKSKVSVDLIVPKKNGAGIVDYQKLLTSAFGFEDGNAPIASAVRMAIRDDYAYAINAQDVKPGAILVPSFSDLRISDPFEAAGAKLTAWLKAHPGKTPDAKALNEIYGGIAK